MVILFGVSEKRSDKYVSSIYHLQPHLTFILRTNTSSFHTWVQCPCCLHPNLTWETNGDEMIKARFQSESFRYK